MIILFLLLGTMGIIATSALAVYSYIAFSIWAELTPITFDGTPDVRGLYYGYYHAHMYHIWVNKPEMAPTIEKLSRLDIELARGIVGTRFQMWHAYHDIPLSDTSLKLRSWWVLYKDRIL
jgi:hypothetical protein